MKGSAGFRQRVSFRQTGIVPHHLLATPLTLYFWNTLEQAVLMSIGLAGWRANGEELFLSDENSPADENPLKTS